MNTFFLKSSHIAAFLLIAGCGTTYQLPDIDQATTQKAAQIFAEERAASSGARYVQSTGALKAQYNRVVRRVEPVAENFCRQQTAGKKGFRCDVTIVVDTDDPARNAYQYYDDAGVPTVAFTIPMIVDARNEDELAFIMGHEFGHHIAEHIKKQQQQAIAGAIALGALTAYAQANDPHADSAQQSREMARNIAIGYAGGSLAFSQSYELESDVIGTYIARAAGYDPVKGARFFARPEPARASNGKLSFWGTHPPDEKRLATVISTANKITQSQTLVPKK